MSTEGSENKELRSIVHLDLDAFFCAVEEIYDPSLRGKAFAVGGSADGRGVVASCSYAARKFGIHSAMPMAQAKRLCPELINVRHSFKGYSEYSRQVMDILRSYSPQIQPISIDEAFLDLSHLPHEGKYYAGEIQREIRHQLGLPASLGIASNKLVAKIATNVAKAMHKGKGYPNAILAIAPGTEAKFLAPLPSNALWGVGPKTAEKLAEVGIHTIGDIANHPFKELERRFGQTGRYLHFRARGIDNSPVNISRDTKSVSHEVTYSKDTADEEKLRRTIHRHAQSIGKRLKKLKLAGKTVKIKIRWPDFTTFTRQQSLIEASDDADIIEQAALALFSRHWQSGKQVRLLGVGVSELGRPSKQLSLWDWDPHAHERALRLQEALKGIENKYGKKVIRPAGTLYTQRR